MTHYLDNAATTPVRTEAVQAAVEAMTQGWGNPSSRYAIGTQAAAQVKSWRADIAKALGCSMEEIMALESPSEYDEKGFPADKSYLECGLPPYLQTSLENMIDSWKAVDSGKKDYHWDMNWSELNADINSAEVEQEISSEQAWYLRETYLRMKRGE